MRPHPTGRDGFAQVLHAEWTKFRTVRGWVGGMAAAALMVVLVAALAGISSDQRGGPAVPIGPGGEPVTDTFYFMHRPLAGNGSVTVSVSSLRDYLPGNLRPAAVPWAKAGLIIKASTRPGSSYAAIMVTSGHGVRMQYDYVNDTAGLPGPVSAASVRWLRLDRSGDAVTGYDSADGTHRTKVGIVRVAGLGPDVQGGLFVRLRTWYRTRARPPACPRPSSGTSASRGAGPVAAGPVTRWEPYPPAVTRRSPRARSRSRAARSR